MKRGFQNRVSTEELLELSSVSESESVNYIPPPDRDAMSGRRTSRSWSIEDYDGTSKGTGLLTEYVNGSLYEEMNKILFGENFNKDTFQKLVAEKKKKYHLGQSAAEVEVIIDRLIAKYSGNLELALLAVLTEAVPEEKAAMLTTKLLYRGADADTVDNNTRTPLHYAAKRGFIAVGEILIEFGASATRVDIEGMSPLSIALQNKNDRLAATLIHSTKSNVIRELFSHRHGVDTSIYSLHSLVKDKSMKLSVKAVLDSLIDTVGWTSSKSIVYYSLLEADSEGETPDSANFKTNSKTCLQLITQTGDQEYISHPAVRILVRRKWVKYARNRFIASGISYIIALCFLTASVILSLNAPNPKTYSLSSAADISRAVCEVMVLIFIVSTLLQEAVEAFKLRKDYFLDVFNYVDLVGAILLILVVPLRMLDLPAQWGVYSAGYLLSVLKIFQYSAIFRRQRAYSQIIFRMATKEFVDFLIMFFIIMLAFSGSFAMALRLDGTLASTNNIRTSDFWNILLTSSRVLIEQGPVLEYFNDQGHVYGWYATILFLAFLFVCMVMLMNILIAQLSDTYESMRRNAQLEVYLNRAWIVSRVEVNGVPFGCQRLHCKHYTKSEKIENEELRVYENEMGNKEDTNKLINKIQLQLHDVDLSARSIRNRQRNQDLILAEILSILKNNGRDINGN